jgi:hypothetical protein
MPRFYSARDLAKAHGVSPSTANRRWNDFPNGVDEQGRRWVEVGDDAALLRYPRRQRPSLALLDAGAVPYSGWPTEPKDEPVVVALLRELEARSHQIDRLLQIIQRSLSDGPRGP